MSGVRPVAGGEPSRDDVARSIGFGCAFLHGGRDRRRSAALVHAAFDAGIRHFDVARLYGEGAAEGIVGEALAGVRDDVTLVSKVGILPTDRSIRRRATERVARTLGRVPGLGRHMPTLRPAEPTFRVFDARRMRRSVETSLRQLRTDRLDILLLHECNYADLAMHGVLDTLSTLRAEGKVVRIGLATSLADTLDILRHASVDVVQIASSALRADVGALPEGAAELIVTHSGLRDLLPIVARVCADPHRRTDWTRTLAFEPNDRAALFAMVAEHAIRSRRSGRLLFSSARPETILHNINAYRTLTFSQQEVKHFAAYVAKLAPGGEQ